MYFQLRAFCVGRKRPPTRTRLALATASPRDRIPVELTTPTVSEVRRLVKRPKCSPDPIPIAKHVRVGAIHPSKFDLARNPEREVIGRRNQTKRLTDTKAHLDDQAVQIIRAEDVVPLKELGRVATQPDSWPR